MDVLADHTGRKEKEMYRVCKRCGQITDDGGFIKMYDGISIWFCLDCLDDDTDGKCNLVIEYNENKIERKKEEDVTSTQTHTPKYKYYLLEKGIERIATRDEFIKSIDLQKTISIENKFEKMFYKKKNKEYIGRVYIY